MEKMFYSISQVSEFSLLPQSVLRYWETVFEELSPRKSPGGTRQYSDEDVTLILKIKNLLYEKGMTIKGVQKVLKNNRSTVDESGQTTPTAPVDKKDWIIDYLKSLLSEIRSAD